MFRKIGEWDDEDGFGPSITEEDKAPVANKNGRVGVLKHMFTLQELESDKSLLLDLKEDVREEASTLGEVTNVVLYDVCSYCLRLTHTDVLTKPYSKNRKEL